MRLSCEEELHRLLRVVHYAVKPVKVTEKKVRPLVSGKTPCETDCEDILAERLLDAYNLLRRIVACGSRVRKSSLNLINELLAERGPDVSYLLVRHFIYALKA